MDTCCVFLSMLHICCVKFDPDTGEAPVSLSLLHEWRPALCDCRPALQAELARLLYPIFIHCYLHLIEKEATAAAAQLMSKHKKRFSEAPGVNTRTRLQVAAQFGDDLQVQLQDQVILCTPLNVSLLAGTQ